MRILYPILLAGLLTTGCSATQHRAEVQGESADRLTVGVVQKEIYIGMAGAEVIAALGSPNIVSTDVNRDEVWVYDKIATDVTYSNSKGGVLGLIFSPIGSAAAAAVGAGSRSAGASSTSQRTLTVVIKLDADNRVRDFAYHTSRF